MERFKNIAISKINLSATKNKYENNAWNMVSTETTLQTHQKKFNSHISKQKTVQVMLPKIFKSCLQKNQVFINTKHTGHA